MIHILFWLVPWLAGVPGNLTLFAKADQAKLANKDGTCPILFQRPLNSTFLVAGEKWCSIDSLEFCYSCCEKTYTVCCDDGTCMDYDPYCRYPKTCCGEPYCGKQCCSHTYGVPCGPVCAPKATIQCCNASTGQLCAKIDTCCNDFCCPLSTFCCPSADKCIPQGETCCGNTSCDANSFCCGNIANQCCPHGYECLATGGCCLPGHECSGAPVKCCREGSKCCGDHCCPNDQNCCGNTCCTNGNVCCDGKCCPSVIGCQAIATCCSQAQRCGETCCSAGQTCCGDHHCCPAGHNCCGDLCCPSGQSCCQADKKCYPTGLNECIDHCCSAGSTCQTNNVEQAYDQKGVLAIGRLKPSKLNLSQYFLFHVLLVEKIQRPIAANQSNPPMQLPPIPFRKINPASYPCFLNASTMNDTCTAWDCLEKIAGCGNQGPIDNSYQLFCKYFRELSHMFNTVGQEFLNCTANCVTAEIVSIIRHYEVKPCCASLVRWQKEPTRFDCWASCGFCTVYLTNHVGFKAIFDKADHGNDPIATFQQFCHLG